MKRRSRKTKQRSKRYRLLIFTLLLAVSLLYMGRRVYRFAGAVFEEKDLEKRRIVLRAENDLLQQRINDYKKGSLIETKAREDLGMIKKGEKIYLIRQR
ncbi:MAG: septum formation initiator family protein [candidate division WOR-3 bacterium]|nr:MAG: septum formation initiator family protein [candidate division WOR-3 bacterium]